MVKRLLAITIFMIFTITAYLGCVFASSTSTLFDMEWKYAYDVLTALNIMDSGENGFVPEKPFTRGDMAVVVAKISGVNDVSLNTVTFSDVASTNQYSGYINAAASLGVINGFTDGTFRPNEPVTYIQMVKVLVSLLGYEVFAENKGGFPVGYLLQANDLKLKNGALESEQPLLYSDAIMLIYKALDVDVLTKVSVGTSENYEAYSGHNLLYKNMKIIKGVGKVTANRQTSLSSAYGVSKGSVKIDDVLYEEANTNVGNYLGHTVEYYYHDDSDNNSLLFAAPKPGKNTIVKIMSKDIASASIVNGASIEISYAINPAKTEKILLPQSADFIYNGVRVAKDLSLLSFNQKVGNVLLINSGSGDYDTVIVSSYETSVVDSVSSVTNTVHLKYPTSTMPNGIFKIDDFAKTEDFPISLNGNIMSIGNLKQWDVISVAKSLDGRFADVLVSREKMTGTIEELNKEDNTIVLDGRIVDLHKEFLNSSNSSSIFVGNKLTLYFSAFGYVAESNKNSEAQSKFAYVVDMKQDTGVSKEVNIKLFCADGSMKTYKLTNKVKNNNSSAPVLAKDLLSTRGVVEFELNSEQKVNVLNTPTIDGALKMGYAKKETLTYIWANESFASNVYVDSGTLIMVVPDGNADDKRYQVLSGSSYFGNDDMSRSFKVSSYNEDKFKVAELIVVYEPINQSNADSIEDIENSFVVDKVSEVMVNDNEAKKLYGYKDGKKVEFIVDEDVSLNGLKRGDMLQIKINVLNEVVAFRKLFDINTFATQPMSNVSLINQSRVAVWGNVIDVDATKKRLSMSDLAGEKFFNLSVTKAVYIYNQGSGIIEASQINEIQPDDIIAMRIRSTRAYEILIIRD